AAANRRLHAPRRPKSRETLLYWRVGPEARAPRARTRELTPESPRSAARPERSRPKVSENRTLRLKRKQNKRPKVSLRVPVPLSPRSGDPSPSDARPRRGSPISFGVPCRPSHTRVGSRARDALTDSGALRSSAD